MAATRAIAARRTRALRLLAVPTSGIQTDVLIGAGCVAELEAAAVSLGELGAGPRFVAAITGGTIRMRDTTCPAVHAALQAAEKGIPFMPLRGLIGSDVLAPPRRLEARVEPIRRGRGSDRAPAGDPAGSRALPRSEGRSQRQRVDRALP